MTTYGPYKATVAAIHDGDTIDLDIPVGKFGKVKGSVDFGFDIHRGPDGLSLKRMSCRLYGCNAAELATAAGKAALAYLETLLQVGDVVEVLSHDWDKYGGRFDGSVTLPDGRDLAAVMIAANQAAPWDGQGTKPVPQAA